MSNELLRIDNLHSFAGDKEILKGLSLTINRGEIHVIMGPNGAGKSTLASTLMNSPAYRVENGDIIFNGQVINDLKTHERAKLGIFLSFQTPEEIHGVTVENFLRTAKMNISGENISLLKFRILLYEKMNMLKIDKAYAKRFLNVGFSGGEKKKNEILQMAILEPKLAILDETDSGLDIDAIKVVSEGIKALANENMSMLVITHHNKILQNLKPDYVHILVDGRIVKTGDASLIKEVEENGFEKYKN